MTEAQGAEMILLLYRLDQWLTYLFILSLIACGWKLTTFFLREQSSLGEQR